MVVLAVPACRRGELYVGVSAAKITATFRRRQLKEPRRAWAKQARLPQRIDDDMD
ncbi:hypothetical protein IMZ48_14930 [Candidatus Bathyarchaeota archaeon]|nr:hypothetical protein [Candidatus Bathyarchaeota archaeon]